MATVEATFTIPASALPSGGGGGPSPLPDTAPPATASMTAFLDAQKRLRTQVGVDAVFVHPGTVTWDASIALNPDTGEPYDPFATPEAVTPPREETVRCGVLTRALSGRSEQGRVTDTAVGSMSDAALALQFDLADFARVDGADTVRVEGEEWKLRQVRRDELGGRGIAFCGHR